jgi:hypothetical protein
MTTYNVVITKKIFDIMSLEHAIQFVKKRGALSTDRHSRAIGRSKWIISGSNEIRVFCAPQ